MYNKMERLGFNFGPALKRMRNILRGSRVDKDTKNLYHFGVGDVEFTEAERTCHPVRYNVPPSVLDAAFHLTMVTHFEDVTFLVMPVCVKELVYLPTEEMVVSFFCMTFSWMVSTSVSKGADYCVKTGQYQMV